MAWRTSCTSLSDAPDLVSEFSSRLMSKSSSSPECFLTFMQYHVIWGKIIYFWRVPKPHVEVCQLVISMPAGHVDTTAKEGIIALFFVYSLVVTNSTQTNRTQE